MYALRLLVLATGAIGVTVAGAAGTVEVLWLNYLEWESGGQPYAGRVLITPRFMRLDYGEDDQGYILLDRGAGMIYSVQVDDHRILEVAAGGGEVGEPPMPLEFGQSSQLDADAPPVAGEQPLSTDFTVNGELCFQTVSVPGLLPDAVSAWREFATIMAAQRLTTLTNTPPELWRPCVLANDIYAPTRYLQYGLPIREHNRFGISRELRGFEANVEQPVALFRLPNGYQRFRIGRDILGEDIPGEDLQ